MGDLYERVREMGGTHKQAIRYESEELTRLGLLDPGQPTEWAHHQWREEVMAPLSPTERALIRNQLGLSGPDNEMVEGE